MAPTSNVLDVHLPKLSSPNLRKLDSSKFDKSQFLRTYIRSQQGHFSNYALEGKNQLLSWNSSAVGHAKSTAAEKPHRQVDLESGFGTPLLKPRTQAQTARRSIEDVSTLPDEYDDSEACTHNRLEDTHKKRDGKRKASPTPIVPRKIAKDTSRRTNAGSKERDSDVPPTKRLRQTDIQEFARPKSRRQARSKEQTKPGRREPIEKERKSRVVDEEHKNRLAERRERRRVKKSIVGPKPIHNSASDHSSVDEQEASEDQGAKKKKGKKKGLSMPAGLALMHGFSATNIGKNRLTLGPGIGVFNKGKASAKTTVRKTKANVRSNMFSEEWFLSKTTKPKRGIRQSDDSPHTESELHSNTVIPPSRKRRRAPSVVSVPQNEESSDHSSTSTIRKPRVERDGSPVWDIELEDGHLPSGSEDGRSVAPNGLAAPCGTILMDTGAFARKWISPKDISTTLAEDVEEQAGADSPSIGPSHSASQVASRRTQLGNDGDLTAPFFSKYFSGPLRLAPSDLGYQPDEQATGGLQSNGPERPQRSEDNLRLVSSPQVCAEAFAADAPLRSSPLSLCDHSVLTEQTSYQQLSQSRPVWRLPAEEATSFAEGRPASSSSSLCLPPGPLSPVCSYTMDYSGVDAYGSDAGDITMWAASAPVDLPVEQYLGMEERPPDRDYTMDASIAYGPASQFLLGMTGYAGLAASESRGDLRNDLEAPHSPLNNKWYGEERDPVYDQLPSVSGGEAPYEAQHPSNDPYCTKGCYADPVEGRAGRGLAPSPLSDGYDGQEADDSGVAFSSAICTEDQDDDVGMDDWDGSEEDEDPTVLASLPRFSQGRALLMGVSEEAVYDGSSRGVSRFEEDVAKNLRSHWLPQRF